VSTASIPLWFGGLSPLIRLIIGMPGEDNSVPQGDLASLVQEAHEKKVCPYSHATRGNMSVSLEVAGGWTRAAFCNDVRSSRLLRPLRC